MGKKKVKEMRGRDDIDYRCEDYSFTLFGRWSLGTKAKKKKIEASQM
jgi:hypothetical protein